jgi:hypothetical protein
VANRSEIGEILARAADEGEPRARLRVPAIPPRCSACAFTRGTPANACLETALDALGCTIEGAPFMCHMHFDEAGRPVDLCSGWVFAREGRAGLQSAASVPSPRGSEREPAPQDSVDGECSAVEQAKHHNDGR